ncbi:MAG TPA: isoprenylcysteine carboxylmethyltransferase family protein [Anaerolineales bacterium]|nr:isoprenylcysteine carboxylmethyltransferase family protein [Anaerolineales bacterium]
MNDENSQKIPQGLDRYGRRRIFQVLLTLAIAMAVVFISAGRLNFLWGWIYLGLALAALLCGAIYVLQRNPQAINERGRPAEGQKSWDKIIMTVYIPLFIGVYILSGLDARYSWSAMPVWLHVIGAILTLTSSALTYGAMAHNKFLSLYVQVAQERGHLVATSGPYQYVRHPMYLSLVLSWPALALLLGSYWALLPGLLASGIIVLRTVLEDRTLQEELPGYADYARQVRYRLVPGIW